MISLELQFAAEPQHAAAESTGGISALGLNLKSFIFQLITFLIVLFILRKYVFPKLVATLEERRKVLEESLVQARQTEETLKATEAKTSAILQQARGDADAALADAHKRAKEIISEAEKGGTKSAARIVKEAEEHLEQERGKLRNELKEELADLVIQTTEKVLRKKINAKEDSEFIKSSIKELS